MNSKKKIQKKLIEFVAYSMQFVYMYINTDWSYNIVLPAHYTDASN